MINAAPTLNPTQVDQVVPAITPSNPSQVTSPTLTTPVEPTFKKPSLFSKIPKKQLAGILVLVLMVAGIAVAGLLTQVNQDIRNQASGGNYNDICIAKFGGSAQLMAQEVTACENQTGKSWNLENCECRPDPVTEQPTTTEPVTTNCSDGQCQLGDICTKTSDCAGANICGSFAPDLPPMCVGWSAVLAECGDGICESQYESESSCSTDCMAAPQAPELPTVDPIVGRRCYSAIQQGVNQCGISSSYVCDIDPNAQEGVCKLANNQPCSLSSECASDLCMGSNGGTPVCQPNPGNTHTTPNTRRTNNTTTTTPPRASVTIKKN